MARKTRLDSGPSKKPPYLTPTSVPDFAASSGWCLLLILGCDLLVGMMVVVRSSNRITMTFLTLDLPVPCWRLCNSSHYVRGVVIFTKNPNSTLTLVPINLLHYLLDNSGNGDLLGPLILFRCLQAWAGMGRRPQQVYVRQGISIASALVFFEVLPS